MVSKRQQKYMAKRQTNGSRKMRASRRVLKGGRRYLKRELSFGMRKKIKYRTSFQPLFVVYALVLFVIITFVAIIYGDYRSVPWYYYLVALVGEIIVDIYILGGRRFDS
ncbi:MAG: hypothetical protein GPJ54_17220 [Candidatus Heimdallarchaeota archaeon]|nr:hypothetical protein [Candidatus Heimdallarchaeota archaeon]